MESLKVEEMEELEVENTEVEEVKPVLEYEKLLKEERDRADKEKALNLIKFGCFNQKQETNLDFSNFEKILQNKKFKGVYDLYRNLETMELVFVAPLVEKSETETVKAPYAYDVITTEYMDEETYKMVCHAAKNNLRNMTTFLYYSSFVAYICYAATFLFLFIYHLITSSSSTFLDVVAGAFYATAPHIAALVLMIPVLFFVSVKYKKYKEK